MEVVIGFAVGYLDGTRQGRPGLQRALDSAQAFWATPETKRLLTEGLTALESVTAPAMDRLGNKSSSRRSALISTVVDELIERRQSRRAA